MWRWISGCGCGCGKVWSNILTTDEDENCRRSVGDVRRRLDKHSRNKDGRESLVNQRGRRDHRDNSKMNWEDMMGPSVLNVVEALQTVVR